MTRRLGNLNMNKYEKALYELSFPHHENCYGCRCGESDCICERRDWILTLQELVDRTVTKEPKKIKKSTFKCLCGAVFFHCKPKYCCECGQKLDWGE